jgi:hypothetical protein
MAESACNSPARSVGDPNSLTDSELTDLESDSQLEIVTEVPGAPDQTIVDGWFKFRDNKRVSFFLKRDIFFIGEEGKYLKWHALYAVTTVEHLTWITPLIEECFWVVLASFCEYSGGIVKFTKVSGCSV